MILDDLLASLDGDAPVRDVIVGAHLTVVASRGCGLASTLAACDTRGRPRVREAGRLRSKSARELAELVRSDYPVEAAIGLAAINSLLEVDGQQLTDLNAADYLAAHAADRAVALVGHFPFVETLRARVGQLWVLELVPEPGDFPASMAPELVPRADIVAVTGSTLVNHTLDGLLALCRPGTPVVVIGPSTPLSPVLFDWGVSVLAGARVSDESEVLRAVAEGASFQQIAGASRVTWSKEGRGC